MRELLAKLQAVFDLPRRLRTAIDRGALELAVGYYADAAPLLHRYGHKVPFISGSLLAMLVVDSTCQVAPRLRPVGHSVPMEIARASMPCSLPFLGINYDRASAAVHLEQRTEWRRSALVLAALYM